ncbi:putative ribonuclease E [Anaeromyxobacter sp. K]|uniref:ribonuclease E n=1 Tax=Anaeromyxobacter sp. (strain K) TaxID=447217 RepID=UPI00017BE371|nr:ribonuclease E [Anaeromyxobacter sp. K]ACG74851.1 putative ribonuclease E [Anaeromyxobacter sp. K]
MRPLALPLAAALLATLGAGCAGARPAAAAGQGTPPPAARFVSPRAIAHYLEARRARGAGDDAGAVAALRRAVAYDEASPELHASLAEALARAGQEELAEGEARRAVALAAGGPAASQAHLLLADLAAGRGERERELEELRRAIRVEEALGRAGERPDPEPWRRLVDAYLEAGDEVAAERVRAWARTAGAP